MSDTPTVCKHLNLKRQCELCERDAMIAELERDLAAAKAELADLKALTCPHCALVDSLKAELDMWRDGNIVREEDKTEIERLKFENSQWVREYADLKNRFDDCESRKLQQHLSGKAKAVDLDKLQNIRSVLICGCGDCCCDDKKRALAAIAEAIGKEQDKEAR